MAELVYANDSKSFSVRIVSSSLTSGTRNVRNKNETEVNSDLVFLIMNWRKYDRKSEKARGGICASFDRT